MKRFIVLVVIVLGGLAAGQAQRNNNDVREQTLKFQRLVALIDAFYVDTVNLPKLTEDAVRPRPAFGLYFQGGNGGDE